MAWILTAVFLSLLALLIVVPLVLNAVWQKPQPSGGGKIVFADPALSADIYADEAYMQLDRRIYFSRSYGGYTETERVENEAAANLSPELKLLIRLVRAAEAGDAFAYRRCFAEEYLDVSKLPTTFTMQKVYDIVLTSYMTAGTTVPPGYVSAATYGIRYKIKDNNGSLREDMGSDCEHEQFVSVVTNASGESFIYGVRMIYS